MRVNKVNVILLLLCTKSGVFKWIIELEFGPLQCTSNGHHSLHYVIQNKPFSDQNKMIISTEFSLNSEACGYSESSQVIQIPGLDGKIHPY